MSRVAVCTLFEGNHHYGVGALANSLVKRGFQGAIWAGYRGPLPPWARTAEDRSGFHELRAGDSCTMRFVKLNEQMHLGNFKPRFMLRVFDELDTEAEQCVYFDPDIIVRFDWSFFEQWLSDHIGLCEDNNSPIADNHPKRLGWRRRLSSDGLVFRNSFPEYLNSGFVGLPRSSKHFLECWAHAIELIGRCGADLTQLGTETDYLFWFNDQDALNIALMATGYPVSFMGKEGMGFTTASGAMLHAIGKQKPWNSSFLPNILAGRPPSSPQRAFWEHVRSPIRLYPDSVIRRRQRENLIAAFVARFYRR